MPPALNGIDHVHVYVRDWGQAEEWYGDVLGFRRVKALEAWAVENGPLTLENPQGDIHLALFESDRPPESTIAFGASGEQFLLWKSHLESHSLTIRLADHTLAWSMYFRDPFGNMHEITTYDHGYVAERLSEL